VLGVRGRIPTLPLRIAGVFLLMAAVASGAYLLQPDQASGSQLDSSGAVGSAAGGFLLSQFAMTGGWTIVIMGAAVGTIMTAGRLIFIPPRLMKRAWLAARESARKTREASARGAAESEDISPAPAGPSAKDIAERRAIIEKISARLRDRAQPADNETEQTEAVWLPSGPGYDESFEIPSMDLLSSEITGDNDEEQAEALRRKDAIQRTLDEFGVEAQVVAQQVGPVVTLFELSLAAGVKVARVTGLSEDIARALAVSTVRVVSPLPGRDTIGLELPNLHQQTVRIREMMDLSASGCESMDLPVCLGKDAGGKPIVTDLASMPHLLIAGTTGSGKSVCLNAILISLLVTRRPTEVRMVLVDPKMVEMASYDGVPHLLCPPVSDMRQAASILNWAADEMDNRYALLRDARVRHITEFNELDEDHRRAVLGIETPDPDPESQTATPDPDAPPPPSTRMPYYVIVVDELADLIMTSSKEVEGHIIRIAQKARAVGIHLILATQRPSVKVVTGLIKANMPCRISFRVASRVESRIILDQNGAESLVGKGDMLLLSPTTSIPVRAQGVFADNSEIRRIADDLRSRSTPSYHPGLMSADEPSPPIETASPQGDLLPQAVDVVLSAGQGSAALLRRNMSLSHAAARTLLEEMTEIGVLGPSRGPRSRLCRITPTEWREIQASLQRRPGAIS
jgi:DNA segregation ATPase FtsK/SpoIIIE, S-DNA-T family